MDLNAQKSIFLDFNTQYCSNPTELLSSETFNKLLKSFIHLTRNRRPVWWEEYENSGLFKENDSNIVNQLIHLFKLLIVFPVEEICDPLIEKKELLQQLIEDLYDYWRHFERYAFISNNGNKRGLQKISFMTAENNFSNLILTTYRLILEKIMGQPNRIYRQVSAGSNASFILQNSNEIFSDEYAMLNNIKLIHTIILHAPFIVYPSNTTRKGVFKEQFVNPILKLEFNKKDWFCFPLKVGEHRARVFFHKDYMNLGLTLSNLFDIDIGQDENINLVLIYGADNSIVNEPVYYKDQLKKYYVGYIPYGEEATYFGYMKKMLLTLHNIANIEKNELPIHGAMFSILFKNRTRKNVVIVGDSGTGKSETLEALRSLANDDINEITVIFDDMGSLKIMNDGIYGFGSETGAFVRLDDLEPGYAYRSIDRAILMNPDKNNARAVIPITTYQNIINGYKVDVLLYANNYQSKENLHFFKNKEEAISTFKLGRRMAKSTTNEKGIVDSYFANPFGPLQEREKVDKLLDLYFSSFFVNKIVVGEIYTKLGIEGEEQNGPIKASLELLKLLKDN